MCLFSYILGGIRIIACMSNFQFCPYHQSVYDEGIPFLEKVLGSHENRVKASPVYGSFEGLPPLCICVSKHEVVYDQAMLLVQRAEDQGVDVTVGIWKYM